MLSEAVVGDAAEVPSDPTGFAIAFRRIAAEHVGAIAVLVVGFGLVLALHGFLPGLSQPPVQAHLATAAVECLHNQGLGGVSTRCDSVGLPVGQPFLSGAPQTLVALPFAYLPGVDDSSAHILAEILGNAVGLAGGFLLARRLGALDLTAALAAVGYLASLSIVFVNGFAATFNGFVLLPMSVFVSISILDLLIARRRQVVGVLGLVVNGLVMAFTDGYGFMLMAVMTAIVWLWTAIASYDSARARAAWIVTVMAANGFAALVYSRWQPSGAYGTTVPIEMFRSMGADVATFVLPQSHLWWAHLTGLSVDFSAGWGDQSAYRSNYLGLILVGLAVYAVIKNRQSPLVVGLAIAAVVAGILSLGPSLKLYDLREPPIVPGQVAYVMPAEEATVGLPTSTVYALVPGFTEMRATYRWIVATVLCLFMLGSVATSGLWRSGRRNLAVILGVLALVEVFPNVPEFVRYNRAHHAKVEAFREGPQAEFVKLVHPDDVVLLLPAGNDFLANAMVGAAGSHSYNVGIDKNMSYSQSAWPPEIRRAAETYATPEGPDAVADALRAGASVVAFPNFDMNASANGWPPDGAEIERRGQIAAQYASDPRFDVTTSQWFTVLRLRDEPVGS